jgi:predicted RNA-binding Zn ribbon-like protein
MSHIGTRADRRPSREPGGRAPAPGSLHLVQRFLNTSDTLTGRDILRTDRDVRGWLARFGLPTAGRPISSAQVEAVRRFRDALRSVVVSHAAGPIDRRSEEALARAVETARVSLRWTLGAGVAVAPSGTGARLVMSAVLCGLAEADDATWRRLKACRSCGWVFFDRSRNRSGVWCTMSVCGARAKMRRHRQRRRPEARRGPRTGQLRPSE